MVTARAASAVAELLDAAQRIEEAAPNSPLPKAVATVLHAEAKHWRSWFPSDPSALDRAMVQLARTVIATYPTTPDADAGTRQHPTSPSQERSNREDQK